MNKRSKTIISLLLSMAMFFCMNTTAFAWVDVKGDFSVICDSEKGYDYAFARMGNNPYEDVVLTSFTNGYNELLSISTTDNNTKGLWVYNEGTIPASFNEAWHVIDIQGYDGHGEEFYINSNFFTLSEEEINNLTLGNLIEDEEYYVPVLGLRVFARPFHKNPDGSYKLLTVSMDIVHDDYYKDNQTWIRITYTGKVEDSDVVDSPVVPEWEQQGFKRFYFGDSITSRPDDAANYIEVVSSNEFTGKKQKPVVTVSYNGNTYTSGKGGKLVVKYKDNKNAGEASVTVKKVKGKGNKEVSRTLKGLQIYFDILPVTVSNNNIKVKKKDTTVKSVKVLTGNKYKKVPKKMWKQNGDNLDFSGNYTGSVSINEIS